MRYTPDPAGIYLLKVNNRNTRTRCEISLKLTIKTLVDFDQVNARWGLSEHLLGIFCSINLSAFDNFVDSFHTKITGVSKMCFHQFSPTTFIQNKLYTPRF